jgi:hypothetical protein
VERPLQGPAQALREHLAQLQTLRGTRARPPARTPDVKRWQAARLERSYADLSAQPRYAAATAFFLDDLYGEKDLSARDEEMLRILPAMSRVLPASAMETAALAIELESLTEALDQRLAVQLPRGAITGERYAEAYRASSTREERLHQVDLIEAVGHRLDGLVKRPMIGMSLKVMRKPAHMAGLGDLQEFLESGYAAFKAMGGADEFLAALRTRETALMERILAGGSAD